MITYHSLLLRQASWEGQAWGPKTTRKELGALALAYCIIDKLLACWLSGSQSTNRRIFNPQRDPGITPTIPQRNYLLRK